MTGACESRSGPSSPWPASWAGTCGLSPVRLEFPILSLNPGLRHRCVALGVWPPGATDAVRVQGTHLIPLSPGASTAITELQFGGAPEAARAPRRCRAPRHPVRLEFPIVALEWRRAPRARVAVIGDGRTGYIVTPVSPETRHILERAAIANGVAFDARWQATERSPTSTTTRTHATPARRRAMVAGPGTTRRRPGHRDRIVFDQALLTHCLVEAARAGRTLTYGDVACRFGILWSQGASAALASALKRIGDENQRRGEPSLMALVVSKKSGTPGRGFFQATGIGSSTASEQRARHREHLRQVWAFAWPD